MYIVDSDEATSWPARWAYIPSFKLNTGHFSGQLPSPKVIFGYSKYPSANQLNVERTIHQLAAKKKPCPAFWRHFPAACSWMFDVTRCYYTHHISHHLIHIQIWPAFTSHFISTARLFATSLPEDFLLLSIWVLGDQYQSLQQEISLVEESTLQIARRNKKVLT